MTALALAPRGPVPLPEIVLAVRVRGADLPINRWSLVVGMAAAVLVVALSGRIAARAGWRPVPTMVALLGLAMVVALTLPVNGSGVGSVAACLPGGPRAWWLLALRLGDRLEYLLNLAMLVPFAVASVLATRRVRLPVLVVLVLPALVELAQTLVPGRQCSPSDYGANVLGGLAAVGVGALLERRPPVRAWLDTHEPWWPVRRITDAPP